MSYSSLGECSAWPMLMRRMVERLIVLEKSVEERKGRRNEWHGQQRRGDALTCMPLDKYGRSYGAPCRSNAEEKLRTVGECSKKVLHTTLMFTFVFCVTSADPYSFKSM